MSNKLVSQMHLPRSVANVFAARNILTAKDALSLPEFELATLLDLDIDAVRSAVATISEASCPPHQTALSLMEERIGQESNGGRLPTLLNGLDNALGGGVPFGVITELVGPSGIGKTQFCLKLSLLATLPACYGGLNGRVIYIDTEAKFSSRRIIEIGENSFPNIFQSDRMAQEMAGRIIVIRPVSISEFNESLHQIEMSILQHKVKLLVIDSMAALVSREHEKGKGGSLQQSLRWPISFLKSLAEFSRIPVLVTNQVRGQTSDKNRYSFQGQKDTVMGSGNFDFHLTAAMGIPWAHAVTIRLVFEAHSGQRFIKVAKSPISPPLVFPFVVESSGIRLLTDEGIQVMGMEIYAIRFQGQSILDLQAA